MLVETWGIKVGEGCSSKKGDQRKGGGSSEGLSKAIGEESSGCFRCEGIFFIGRYLPSQRRCSLGEKGQAVGKPLFSRGDQLRPSPFWRLLFYPSPLLRKTSKKRYSLFDGATLRHLAYYGRGRPRGACIPEPCRAVDSRGPGSNSPRSLYPHALGFCRRCRGRGGRRSLPVALPARLSPRRPRLAH